MSDHHVILTAVDRTFDEHAMALLRTFSPAAHATAVEFETSIQYGLNIGLTEDEVQEVIFAWNSWYQQAIWPLSWEKVRNAINFATPWKPLKPSRLRSVSSRVPELVHGGPHE